MKKLLLTLSVSSIVAITLSAQNLHPVSGEPLKYCGSTEATQELYKKYPGLQEAAEVIQQQEESRKSDPNPEQQPPIYTIPVVVHILHNYGAENIPDANVKDAIRILNEDFRKLNADVNNVQAPFLALAGDAEIEFQLAKLDPSGNCTNGIDRIVTPRTYAASDASKLNQWPRNMYLNIWTVNYIGSGAAGYTYVPASVASNPSIDGIIILYNYFGALSPSSAGTARALTHEIGHWINLAHTWGSTNQPGVSCSGTDNVADTPTTKGWTTCNLSTNDVCTPGTDENVENYMEYAYCQKMFTAGQCTRMRTACFSTTAQRNNLWSAANLTATGVSSTATLCTADFKCNKTVTCVGTNLTFTDLSWNGTMTTWQWDFDGNTTIDATTQNPTYAYTAPGVYAVTLTVGNGVTTKTTTKTAYMTVMQNTTALALPYAEGFEATGFPYTDLLVVSASGNANGWNRVTTAAYTGSASVKMDNHTPTSGDIDEFITPVIDMSTVTAPTMNFKVAHRRRSSTDTLDQLRVLTSVDCGITWNQRYIKTFTNLPTVATVSSAAFTPASTTEWRQDAVAISNVTSQAKVRFRFEFIGHGVGNNIYIDDININGTPTNPSVDEEFQNAFSLNVYPNPFDETTTITFTTHDKYLVGIGIYDVLGKEIIPVSDKNEMSAGTYTLPLDKTTLKPGIYFVKLDVDGYTVTKKIIVQ